MTTTSGADIFGSRPTHIEKTMSTKKQEGTIVKDDLILTQPDHPKVSRTTKNGRYISQLVDGVSKMQKRTEFSDHDKRVNNLSLYWYIRTLLLSNNQYDDDAAQIKLFEWYELLNKFDRNSDDYREKIGYLYTMLQDINHESLNELGINPENFMFKNFNEYDGIGLSTFSKDIFYQYDDLVIKTDNDSDKPETKLPSFEKPTDESCAITSQPVPKILHILYYKSDIDIQYLYTHLASYTANRDYKIIVWMHKFPEHGLRSNDHIEFKTFDQLDCETYHACDDKEFEWDDKFKLKYHILKEYGGIYTDYSIAGVKKFSESLSTSSFISVFTTNYKDQQYICPLGFFMGFPPNHPYINYILDNFAAGADICKTEYIYLRSALINSHDNNIRLLKQIPENKSNNISYIELRDLDFKSKFKYFDYKDFDNPEKVIEGTDADKPIISDDNETPPDSFEHDRQELDEIEQAIDKITNKKITPPASDFFSSYFRICLVALAFAYYYTLR